MSTEVAIFGAGAPEHLAWSHSEYDRLLDAFNTTLDRGERIQQVVQMMRIAKEELPIIPLYFDIKGQRLHGRPAGTGVSRRLIRPGDTRLALRLSNQ